MGIRFLCHHCEKRLNVKSTQAGEEGQCPHCLETILVPSKSTIPNPKQKANQPARRPSHSDSDSIIGLIEADESAMLDQTIGNGASNPKKSGGAAITPFILDKPAPPETLGKVDPIEEAPKRVWYFRSKELGEKGPLKAKAMREHLDKGDVKVGCIVWREDWEDWLPAEKVFPTLAATAKELRQKEMMNRAFKDANYQIPDEFNPHSELNRKRRRKHQIFVAAIALGICIIGVLVFVLVKLLGT